MKAFLKRNAPPGYDWEKDWNWYLGLFAVAVCWSMGFLINYLSERGNLYFRVGKALIPDRFMPPFFELLGASFLLFVPVFAVAIVSILNRYAYHKQGACTLDLMRRLPNRRELPRRCALAPLCGIAAALGAMLVLLLVYYAIYRLATPVQCLYPDQLSLWQAARGVFVS